MSPVEKPKKIEEIYQKKTQLEHILLRPDTYIGSVEFISQPMWVFDPENKKMVHRTVNFVPGLYKIFDEILVNAADNKVMILKVTSHSCHDHGHHTTSHHETSRYTDTDIFCFMGLVS